MRIIVVFLLAFLIHSCIEEESAKTEQKDTPIDQPKTSEIAIRLNRDKIRIMNASTAQISRKIQEVLFGPDSTKLIKTIEELNHVEIEFKNNNGDLIKITVGEIIDTAYYQ